jgi:hypothetical protein
MLTHFQISSHIHFRNFIINIQLITFEHLIDFVNIMFFLHPNYRLRPPRGSDYRLRSDLPLWSHRDVSHVGTSRLQISNERNVRFHWNRISQVVQCGLGLPSPVNIQVNGERIETSLHSRWLNVQSYPHQHIWIRQEYRIMRSIVYQLAWARWIGVCAVQLSSRHYSYDLSTQNESSNQADSPICMRQFAFVLPVPVLFLHASVGNGSSMIGCEMCAQMQRT